MIIDRQSIIFRNVYMYESLDFEIIRLLDLSLLQIATFSRTAQ